MRKKQEEKRMKATIAAAAGTEKENLDGEKLEMAIEAEIIGRMRLCPKALCKRHKS